MDVASTLATTEDDSFLARLFYDVRAPEFAPLSLPSASLDQLLAMQFRAQRSGFATEFPNACDYILRVGDERVGRMLVNETHEEIRLVDIALLTPYRGQGLGESLLRTLCQRAAGAGLPLRLSVRPGNPALRLYERLGFRRISSDGINIAMEAVGPAPAALSSNAESPLPVTQTSAADVPRGLSSAYFQTLLGQPIHTRTFDYTEATLVLETWQPLTHPPEGPQVTLGDSFVLSFLGPAHPVLPSALADLMIEGGEPLTIFLTPVAVEVRGIRYEAIFNRMAIPTTSQPGDLNAVTV
jgi:ribosomal protein S18 acetylase RimI-like enzyme